jgi:uncharacterized repeat protein (TIGR04052 family)
MRKLRIIVGTLAVSCGATSSAVDGGESHGHDHTAVTEIRFKAKVGTADFGCGTRYTMGEPPSQYQPRDFRFYVSDVALISKDGTPVPFALTADGVFQSTTVALLDFENGTGGCVNGTTQTHSSIVGRAPGGHYEALEFTIGVPFDQNHQDASAAAPPLNSTAMFWNWQGGYKFIKIEGTTTGLQSGHNVHLGSTGCMAGATPNSVVSCAASNRLRVTLTGFEPETSAVVMDLAALLSGSNLDTNVPMTAPGCMSGATDTDCSPIFERLGLPFGTAATPAVQTVFRLEP